MSKMPKDYKIGMLCGLVAVIVAGLWMSIHPSLSIKASIAGPKNVSTQSEPIEQPRFEPNLPAIRPVVKEAESEREELKTVRYHTVSNGDTLSDISYQYYGSENKWQKIFDANRDVIQDVSRLRLGVRLIIPE
ncbi:MAG: LysM peptidoglycan-binding domain-containing protein [Planctomycetota bacterium]|jgi:nucleoid-associated protein YgaU